MVLALYACGLTENVAVGVTARAAAGVSVRAAARAAARADAKVAARADAKEAASRLATVRSGPDRGLFWRLLKRLDCTVQSFVGLDWTVPKDRTVQR